MIKLAIISDDPGHGGAYKVAHDIAYGLPIEQYEVKFFFLCERPSSSNAPEGIYLGAPKFDFDFSLIDYLKLAFSPSKAQYQYEPLEAAIQDFQPDIIHFHSHIILLMYANNLKKCCSKIIFTDHSQRIRIGEMGCVKTKLMGLVYRKILKNVTCVFVSKYAFDTSISIGYGYKEKDTFIENSVDVDLFKPIIHQNNGLKIVYLSRIFEGKGHEVLLEAWKMLPKVEGIELELYGVEADGGKIRDRIKHESYPNPIKYQGITEKPASVLQQAFIGVFPSYREGMPLALLEMMATGLPIVASDIPEISSLVTDQEDLLLFRKGDAKDLKEKLMRLIENPSMRKLLGINARKKVEKDYSKPIWISYHELYKKYFK